MSLVINTTSGEQGLLVRVTGEVDVSNAPELREALDAAITKLADGDVRRLEVDLSEVPYIDSTGIGVLVGTVHRADEHGIAVVVARPQRNVARVLKLLGLSEELGVTDEQDQ
ncbi:MAG: STAS domain-containing protein [Atopobiaceae bacterium]|nr:STAS domain-containing protein [Atopobiaceae bacterium]